MTELYVPRADELAFRAKLLADAETMSYNAAWGGTIDFDEERQKSWAKRWLSGDPGRFYAYLFDRSRERFVGECAYHTEDGKVLVDVIVLASERGKGYGTAGLALLCAKARRDGIRTVYDVIAHGNPSLSLFLKNGFVIAGETADGVIVRKEL